jgi:hypothetical protein
MSVEDLVFICLFDDLKEKALSCGQGRSVNVNTNWQIIKYGDPDIPHIISMYGFKYLKYKIQVLSDDDWIVCPIQIITPTQTVEKSWDIQVGISGKCKIGQDTYDGMLLELQEELGLEFIGERFDGNTENDLQDFQCNKYSRTTFLVDINQTKLLDSEHTLCTTSKEDDRSKKIVCLVYGKLSDVVEKININLTKRTYLCNDDNIVGMALLSVKTIKHHMIITGHIKCNKNY